MCIVVYFKLRCAVASFCQAIVTNYLWLLMGLSQGELEANNYAKLKRVQNGLEFLKTTDFMCSVCILHLVLFLLSILKKELAIHHAKIEQNLCCTRFNLSHGNYRSHAFHLRLVFCSSQRPTRKNGTIFHQFNFGLFYYLLNILHAVLSQSSTVLIRTGILCSWEHS